MSAPSSSSSSSSSAASSSSSPSTAAKAAASNKPAVAAAPVDEKHVPPVPPADEDAFRALQAGDEAVYRDDSIFKGADSEEPICPYDYDAPFSQEVFRSLEVMPAQTGNPFPHTASGAPKSDAIDVHGDNGPAAFNDKGLVLAMSLLSTAMPQRVLSPMPAFVEPNTTLHSTCSDANRVFDAVVSAIAKFDDTQHVLHPKEFVVRAAMFNPSCVIFHVSLYEADQGIAVEFQRRSGDSVDFAKVYQFCNSQLQADGLVAKNARGGRSFGCPPLPGFDDEATLDKTDFDRLLGMASSPFVDVAREGAGALAQLSRHSPNLPCFRASAADLSSLVAHRDSEVRRCAATILSNMAFQWPDAKAQISGMVSKLLQSCVGSDQDLILLELRRQVHRAMAYMQ